MNVEEMREELRYFCTEKQCSGCLLNKVSRCGRGYSFKSKTAAEYDMTDDEIITAYKLVFPEKMPTEIPTEPTEDVINHPNHYTNSGMECIDEMETVFGTIPTMHFCLLNVWKYRKRALHKNGEEDLAKSDWYMAKYKELKEKLDGKESV